MASCGHCGASLTDNAANCPVCGAAVGSHTSADIGADSASDQPMAAAPKRKRRALKIILLIVAALVVLGGLAQCACCSLKDANEARGREYDWPTGELAQMLPSMDVKCANVLEGESSLSIRVEEGASKEGYEDYVSECKERGFSVDAESDEDEYSAYNEEGYFLELRFSEYGDPDMNIDLHTPRTNEELAWPKHGLATLLPPPGKAKGSISADTSSQFQAYVGDTSKEEFKSYIDACMEKGFTVDYSKDEDYFTADDTMGNSLRLEYQGFNTMYVSMYAPREEDEGEANTTSDASVEAADLASTGNTEPAQEPAPTRSDSGFDLSGTIEPTVMLDNDVLKVEATGLEYRNDDAYLELAITNKTKSEISVTSSTLGYSANYVNDCMMSEGYISSDIPAGETVEEEARYDLQELQLEGLRGIGEIGLGLRVVNEDYDELFEDMIAVRTSLYGTEGIDVGTFADSVLNPTYLNGMDLQGKMAVSGAQDLGGSGVVVQSAGIFTNRDGDKAAMVEFKNSSDKTIRVAASNITVDGTMVYEGLWTSNLVAAGKRALMDDIHLSYMVEENASQLDLSNVKQLGMEVAVYDANDNTILKPTEVRIAF